MIIQLSHKPGDACQTTGVWNHEGSSRWHDSLEMAGVWAGNRNKEEGRNQDKIRKWDLEHRKSTSRTKATKKKEVGLSKPGAGNQKLRARQGDSCLV